MKNILATLRQSAKLALPFAVVTILALLLVASASAQEKKPGSLTIGSAGPITWTGTGSSDLLYRGTAYASYSETIESTELTEDGKLEIVKRSTAQPSIAPAIGCLPGPCDYTIRRLWKEVYTVKDGKIVLEKTVEGKIVPACGEVYEFPKQ